MNDALIVTPAIVREPTTILIDGATITVVPPGVQAMRVHNAADCAGRTCIVHSPTDHGMRHLPLHWRGDRGIFERLCPHGVGHPDPDQQAYWRELAARDDVLDEVEQEHDRETEPAVVARDPDQHVAAMMVHGCCGHGCCQ